MGKLSGKLSMQKVDREWQARDDIRILAEARKIEKDKDRMAAAKAMAKKMLEESKQVAQDMGIKK